ncbi:MAG: hypothetical protein K0U38_01450 [Epsilonproteobacteria bacterium]|nr:hypothetical protein [Campylobacterota bacterium]
MKKIQVKINGEWKEVLGGSFDLSNKEFIAWDDVCVTIDDIKLIDESEEECEYTICKDHPELACKDTLRLMGYKPKQKIEMCYEMRRLWKQGKPYKSKQST